MSKISPFFFYIFSPELLEIKNEKVAISPLFWIKMKKNTTLFFPTLKVRENKVVLFFQFELK